MSKRLLVLVLTLSLTLPAWAKRDEAEGAYHDAARAYYVLKADGTRRKFRHQWLNVVQKFEAVATKFPKSARAPDALFTAAGLRSELSRISLLDEDLKGAVTDYQKLLESYPKHRLVDDSALALGRIYADRLDQPSQARKVMNRALELQPKADQAKQLKSLLASLPSAPAQKPVAKTVAARITVRPPPPREHPLKEEEPSPSAALLEAIAKVGVSADAGEVHLVRAEVQPPHVSDPIPEPAPLEPAPEAAAKAVPAVAIRAVDAEELKPSNKTSRAEPKPKARKGEEEGAVAEQLGQKFRRVVIDAGHGGHDSGAVGKGGVKEKDVTLAIAKRVADMLADSGLEVVLTRDDDRYIKLEDRAQLANETKGDLFVSIHCNSAQSRSLRGIETYTLNTASDRYSIRLAARENSSPESSISDLQFILADLATKANTDDSHQLASRVQRSLVSSLRGKYSGIKDLGQKEALFYVLLGAKMPAILVETSFLSHAEEEQRLGSRSYQNDIARAIADGVEDFLGNHARLAKKD